MMKNAKRSIIIIFVTLLPFCSSQNERVAIENSLYWNGKLVNTVETDNLLSTFEKQVFVEMNKAVTSPALYAQLYIEPLLDRFEGKNYLHPDGHIMETEEGVSAVLECIEYLKKIKPMEPFKHDPKLTRMARIHAVEQKFSGRDGHSSNGGMGFYARASKYIPGYIAAGENIAYGELSPREIIVTLLIDDGIKCRGHRLAFFKDTFNYAGVARDLHPIYGYSCVIDFQY